MLLGGFPRHRTTLIKGSAGTGKTVLGLEFLCRSAMNGEPVILVSFEESAESIRQNALAMGWDIAALEEAGVFFLWEAKVDRTALKSGQFGIDSFLAGIGGKAEQMNAERIMIDAVDVFMRVFEDEVKERNELCRLHEWLVDQRFTALLTAKSGNSSESMQRYEFLDYMADCVLLLDLRVHGQVATRRLRVVKYRGSGFCSNEYPYIITSEGSVFMPLTAMRLMHRPIGEKVSSGNPDLDERLGGGFHRGSGIVVTGASGGGKTTLAANFTQEACSRGERVLFVSFEESKEAIISAMLSPGIDLRPAVEKGTLEFHTIMPEALVPEAHLYRISQKMERFHPDHLVIDAISACRRIGGKEAAFDLLIRLIDICRQRGITCLMTNQFVEDGSAFTSTGLEISSIADTLLSISFVESDGRIQRDLVIVKSRAAHHSNRHHLYVISDDGIQIDPLEGGTGRT